MTERLRLIDTDLDAVAWDAYRSDDGTWQVTGAWRAGDKSGTTRWTFDLPSRTVTPSDAATMDFAEGTRLVRVVPDVPGRPDPGTAARRGVDRRARRPAAPSARPRSSADDDVDRRPSLPDDLPPTCAAHDDEHGPRRAPGRPARPTTTGRSTTLLDEVAEHDTVVLGRGGEDAATTTTRAPASRRGRTSSSGSAATAERRERA